MMIASAIIIATEGRMPPIDVDQAWRAVAEELLLSSNAAQ